MARTLRGLGVPTPPDASVAYAAGAGRGGHGPSLVGLLGGPGHARAPPRGRRRLRPGLRRRVRGAAAAERDEPTRPSVESVTVLVDTRGRGRRRTRAPTSWSTAPSSRCGGATARCCATRTSPAARVAELDEAHRLMADLRLVGARRRSRRLRPSRRRRGPLDLGATTRARPAHRRRAAAHRPPPGRATGRGGSCCSATCPARWRPTPGRWSASPTSPWSAGPRSRCSRSAPAAPASPASCGSRDPDAALDAAAGVVDDWSGGTRLGEGLRTFNDTWGVRGLARGAVVVILSDGWDRGDPAVLGEQVRRLQRVAHRLVWVNPLKAQPGLRADRPRDGRGAAARRRAGRGPLAARRSRRWRR